jgi:hypothetical protein
MKTPTSARIANGRSSTRRIEALEDRITPGAVVSFAHVSSISFESPASSLVTGNTAAYHVTFDTPVTGVDGSDFKVVTTGDLKVSGGINVTGSGVDYTVTLTGLSGEGDLRLDLIDNDSILGGPMLTPLGNPGENASFAGPTYHVTSE